LRRTFEPFGRVAAGRIVIGRYSSVSRGFGFVEMADQAEARSAIEGLNMKEVAGCLARVKIPWGNVSFLHGLLKMKKGDILSGPISGSRS
jgi:RNA recognition motif-containing protein